MWNQWDEQRWDENYIVICPYLYWDFVIIHTDISKLTHCPYQLEIILRESRDAG
jgi:hypothetical protein